MKTKLQAYHHEIYNAKPTHMVKTPGRIHFIGEQAEEMGSDTLSMTMDKAVYLGLSMRKEKGIHVKSEGLFSIDQDFAFNKQVEISPDQRLENHVQGVLNKLHKEGLLIKQGMNISIITDLTGPHGFAQTPAFTYAIIMAINEACAFNLTTDKLVRFADAVFKEYLKTTTRLHDLITIANGKEGCAIYIEGKTKAFEIVPYPFTDYALYAFFPDKVHDPDLTRYKACMLSAKNATMHFDNIRPINKLCEFPYDLFNRFKNQLTNEEERRIAEHIIFEHDRVKNAKDALIDKDIDWFTEYLNQSQKSLNELLDLSTNDLNLIVDQAMISGALAARISNRTTYKLVIALFKNEVQDETFKDLTREYEKLYKKKLHILKINSGTGAHKL